MITKSNLKYYVILLFTGILFYKVLDKPLFIVEFFSFLTKLLTPFLIGIFIAVIANPLVSKFDKNGKMGRGLSILVTYFLGLFVLGVIIVLIAPTLFQGFNDLFSDSAKYLNETQNWFNSLQIEIPFSEQISDIINTNLKNITEIINENVTQIFKNFVSIANNISTSLLSYAIGLTSQILNIIFGLTISIYLLIEKEQLVLSYKKFMRVYLPKHAENINYFVFYSYYTFQDYIVGRLLDSAIIGVIAFAGFSLLNTNYVTLFAFIIFITNIIPYFGPIIGAIVPIFLTFITDPIKGIWVALFVLFLQQLDGNVIGPKIMGDRVGLSPFWVVTAVILGGALFGFIGFFLAVPVVAVIKEMLSRSINERFENISQK